MSRKGLLQNASKPVLYEMFDNLENSFVRIFEAILKFKNTHAW